MKFMVLIFGNEQAFDRLPEAERNQLFAEHGKYTEDLKKSGKLVEGFALQPEATARRVRLKGGKRVVTDGPFAETKEVIGGYYLIDVASREEAIEWGKRCPLLEGEFAEVRPVLEM